MQWLIQDLPEAGTPTPPGATAHNFDKISQKLHEIERIWTGGGARPKCYYVDPPLERGTAHPAQFSRFAHAFETIQWQIYIVKFWTRPPSGSKFFKFHAVFGKYWHNRMLAPPSPQGSWRPPPRGNPGSATAIAHTTYLDVILI